MAEASDLPEDERELLRIQEVARYVGSRCLLQHLLSAMRNRYYCATNFPLNDVASPNIESTKPCDGFDAAGSLTSTQPVRPVQISPEPTLTALAQLGALKLGCQRSFVSIIDHNSQYVLAEATKSLSLREQDIHKEGDALYLGIQSLPLYWGVCPSTMKTFTDLGTSLELSTPNITANRTRYIVRDFLEEVRLKDRPYVVEWPFMRFYAEVPIRSPTGYVIGGYCVIDDRPRGEFGDAEVRTMQEISDSIANHLELMRMKQDFERAERLMKGLSSFVEGQSSIRLPSSSGPSAFSLPGGAAASAVPTLGQFDAHGAMSNGGHAYALDDGPEHKKDPTETIADANGEVGENSPQALDPFPTSQDGLRPHKAVTGKIPDSLPALELSGSDSADAAVKTLAEGTLAPSNIKRTFSRASNLIRESMDLCGVVFFDAYLSGLATRSKLRIGRPDHLPDLPDNDDVSSGDDEWTQSLVLDGMTLPNEISLENPSPKSGATDQKRTLKECKTLGQSLNISSPFETEPRAMPEILLKRLLRNHPHGQIFSSEHSTFVDNAEGKAKSRRLSGVWQICGPRNMDGKRRKVLARQADSQLLFELLPRARSIIFYPLWDSHKARWFAGCIGWTTDPKRALQSEEVTYLAAFGNSVMAEINRIEAVANDMAKSDFISNISHELRSPLHGILASAELLQDSSTGPEQDGMIEMVHVCGRTLLDTMNHLLDHAKINNLSKAKRASSGSSPEREGMHGPLGPVSNFDLSELVEEVVESVYSGWLYQKKLSASLKEGASNESAPAGAMNGSQKMNQQVISVILDIQARTNWIMTSEAGAWRRIVMNLFGNSLKYTQLGFIKVAIWANEIPSLSAGSKSTVVHLSVTDTGKGISQDYLKNRLYTPFAQEDALSVGAGLGLSIVQQIVTALRGTVDIQSKVDCGTNVTVSIPLNERPTAAALLQDVTNLLPRFPGLTVCLLVDAQPDTEDRITGIKSLRRKSQIALFSSISQVLANLFGIKVVYANSEQTTSADLFMIEEERLNHLKNETYSHPRTLAGLRAARLIVLCQSSLTKSQRSGTDPETTTYVTQPFGPMKLAKALNNSLRPGNGAMDMTHDSMTEEPLVGSVNGPSRSGENENGFGTIPIDLSPKSNSFRTPESSTKAIANPERPRVLLVDDNDINLKIMVTYMRKLQCSFEVATDGLQAYDKYRDTAERGQFFTYILMDVSMPAMDGLSATREIRAFEREQGLSRTNIIALTGLASTKTEEEAFASGVDLFLTKPVQLKKLRDVLQFYDDQNQASRLNGGPTKKRKVVDAH
jgi:signal transduction histidine kinase/CheY-like chemotaxis protein